MNPKVLVLPSFYPIEMDFPRGVFFKEQTELINKYGGDATILYNEARSITSLSFKKLIKFHFQKSSKYENNIFVLRRHSWNVVPTRFQLGKNIWIKQSLDLFDRYVSNFGRPDLLHVHCALHAGSVAKIIKEKYNIPYLVTEHSTFFATREIDPIVEKEISDIYNNANKLITVSNPFKELILKKIRGINTDVSVIPNFIDTDFFDPYSDSIIYDKQEIVLFCTCYHEPKKNLYRLIDAFKEAFRVHNNLRLILGGEGSETINLKKYVKDKGLDSVIEFPGFLDRVQIRDYLNNSDLFVLSSDYETFGVVLIEAMSMGVPVLSTDSGGPEDFINAEVGYVSSKDTNKFADCILDFIIRRNTFNKKNIRNYAISNFSGKAVAKKYVELYKDLLY